MPKEAHRGNDNGDSSDSGVKSDPDSDGDEKTRAVARRASRDPMATGDPMAAGDPMAISTPENTEENEGPEISSTDMDVDTRDGQEVGGSSCVDWFWALAGRNDSPPSLFV